MTYFVAPTAAALTAQIDVDTYYGRRIIDGEVTMRYLTFIRHSEKYRESPPPAALMEAMGGFIQKSLEDGKVVDTGGLLPSKDGVLIRVSGGKISVKDGPFADSKEVIGGWAILKTSSRAEAIR